VSLSSLAFLCRYYIVNAIQSKLGGKIADRLVAKNAAQWRALQEKYHGHAHWLVIGNGPSLNVTDLEALQHVPSIASNKINLLFEKSGWRPTLYTVADALLLFKFKASQYENLPTVLVPSVGLFMCKAKRKLPYRVIEVKQRETNLAKLAALPDPVTSGFYQGYTVTLYNIQLAMWLGAKTVYLIGCDHFYKESQHGGVKKLAHDDSQNHFHPDYRKQGEIVNNAPVDKMDADYRMIERLARSHGVEIINITRKTALDIFERGTVEEAARYSRKNPKLHNSRRVGVL
jgi:Protein of unknown function DUF115